MMGEQLTLDPEAVGEDDATLDGRDCRLQPLGESLTLDLLDPSASAIFALLGKFF
jgi:hypothetical protein